MSRWFYQFTPSAPGVLKGRRKAADGKPAAQNNNMKKLILPSLAALTMLGLVTGCDTPGLSAREHSGVTYPNYILNLPGSGTNRPSPVTLPLHLAVAQAGEVAPSSAMLDRLAARPDLIAGVNGLPLPDAVNDAGRGRPGDASANYAQTVAAACRLARATGADYVFLYGGTVDTWRKSSSLNLLDCTWVGAAIFPATQIHVEGKASGALIEATSGTPVWFVTAEDQEAARSPDLLVNGRQAQLTVQTRDALANRLAIRLLDKLAANQSQRAAQ